MKFLTDPPKLLSNLEEEEKRERDMENKTPFWAIDLQNMSGKEIINKHKVF